MYLAITLFPLVNFVLAVTLTSFVSRLALLRLMMVVQILTLFLAGVVFVELMQGPSSCVLTLGSWIQVGSFTVNWVFLFDQLSVTMILLILVISTLVQLYSLDYMGADPHLVRFMSYLSIFTFFMLMFVSAGNYLQMFFGWEGVGLSSYLLINFWFTRLSANKSAMKAIIVNRVSDACLYFAILLIFYLFGTLDYAFVSETLRSVSQDITVQGNFVYSLICLGIFIGAVGKSAQLGLHTWLPDAMEGPTPVSALLHAATMVTAGVFLIIRNSFLFDSVPTFLFFILFVGSMTTFFAGTVGCFQNDIKKIIAYSTCSQLGYMFLSCGLAQYTVCFFHLFNHAFFKALLFLGAGSVIHALLDEQDIRKMGGLFNVLPVTYVTFFLASLSLMGLPYLTGFYSKDLIVEVAYFQFGLSSVFAYWMSMCSVFFTSFYSIRVFYYTFLVVPNFRVRLIFESGYLTQCVLLVLAVLSVFVGFCARDLLVGLGGAFWQLSVSPGDITSLIDAEFSPIYAHLFAKSKFYPLFFVFIGLVLASLSIAFWRNFTRNSLFRNIYEFLNQKWYFDVVYFNFIVQPVMYFSYFISYKTFDRGLFEFVGGLAVANNLKLISHSLSSIYSGNLYSYISLQLICVSTLLFCLFLF